MIARVHLTVLTLGLVLAAVPALAQVPDVRQMNGVPMASGDVAAGTVTVRLVRGDLSNNITGHPVELHGGARVLKENTNAEGRAQFVGLSPGTSVHAVSVVDGERLESKQFEMPPTSGIRLILVAGAGSAAAAGAGALSPAGAATPAPGEVVFGGQSRIQIEFDDDSLEVFYLLEVVNPGAAPVTPRSELVFELPEGAQQASILEGSSPQASVRGRTVAITGSFAPGSTPVQVAFGLGPAGAERILSQKLPVVLFPVQVIVTQVGGVRMASPQFNSSSDVPNDGRSFLLGTGPALPAGTALSVTLSGLPARSRTGRNVALALACLVLAAGVIGALSSREASGDAGRRHQLHGRREKLMADMVRLEQQHRAGAVDEARFAVRRSELVAQLERVYGELDRRGGSLGQGQAA